MAPERFTVQNGKGRVRDALHPDKRVALQNALAKSGSTRKPKPTTKRRYVKKTSPQEGRSLIEKLAYRLHDPVLRNYFKNLS